MKFDEAPQGNDISTDIRSFPEPPVHGGAASFVTSEDLYEMLHNRLVTNVNDAVVAESFSPDFLPGDDYCILLTTSNWRAGIEENGRYRPYQEFSFKIREKTEAGGPKRKTPRIALNVTVAPQDPDAVTVNGTEFTCPFGKGTLINVQTTNVGTAEGFVDRAAALLDAVIGHDMDRSHIKPASKRVTDLELTHRFKKGELGPVVETLRDTETLITHADGPADAHRSYDGQGWVEAELSSSRFDLLGFVTDREVSLKVYTPRDSSAASVIRHPRIEARLGEGETLHFGQFGDVAHRLRAIICSHLLWSDVRAEDLVTTGDPLYQTAQSKVEWDHPLGRHDQLRERYASVATRVKKEALKPNTMAVYDILETLIEYIGATYRDLMDEVGLSYSAIQHHVHRLVEKDILVRETGACTLVHYASRDVRERARQALKSIYPGEGAKERCERREARRERRESESESEVETTEEKRPQESESSPERGVSPRGRRNHAIAEGIHPEPSAEHNPPPDKLR